ncbi:MAG: hypothetical protein FWG46_00345 [Treponema sp.]|nr:hypothetical protein [Treponema sp.]
MKSKLNFLQLVLTVIVVCGVIFAACIEPSPLYGQWTDNKGNSISFFNDGKFAARVGVPSTDYDGTYTLLNNVISLNCPDVGDRGMTIVSEWDIRGNILYINWVTVDGQTLALTMFKISN